MKIKKLEEETLYLNKIVEHTFEVNGKKVRVEQAIMQDNEHGEYDGDTNINEDDYKNFTDLEKEMFGETLDEHFEMKIDEVKELSE